MTDMDQSKERKEKGQGTIIQRGKKWVARLKYTDELHNPKEKSFTCATKAEAEKKLKDFIKALHQGDVNPGTSMNLGEWLEQVMRTVYKAKIRPNTYSLYEGFIEQHLKPLAKVPLNKLTPAMCDGVIADLKKAERTYTKEADGSTTITIKKEKPLSGQSKTLVRRFLIGALNHAVRLGYLKENPAQKTLPPLRIAPKMRVLTTEEARALLAHTTSPQYKAMFAFQLYLGLRIGEVLGIKWVDLERKGEYTVLHIRQQMQRNRQEKKVMEAELKTPQAQRSLELPQELVVLVDQLESRGEFVFSTQNGTPLEPRNAQRALDAHCKKAKLGKVTTHSLRRTSASMHLQAGTGLGIIKDILGHTDIRTTTLYAKSSLAANREANSRLKLLMGE